jgi:hypothetical protein
LRDRYQTHQLLQRREGAQVDFARLDPEHVGPLPADRSERGHDRGRRGEELVIEQAEAMGDRAEAVLEVLRRMPRAVEGAAQLEHEAHG